VVRIRAGLMACKLDCARGKEGGVACKLNCARIRAGCMACKAVWAPGNVVCARSKVVCMRAQVAWMACNLARARSNLRELLPRPQPGPRDRRCERAEAHNAWARSTGGVFVCCTPPRRRFPLCL
jgi:hypothetical protein